VSKAVLRKPRGTKIAGGAGMRDKRFVAEHRGGPLKKQQHRLLAIWAAACAERVVGFCVDRDVGAAPLHAITVARAWARGEVPVGDCQKAALEAHGAARTTSDAAAKAAARAAAHAVATAHFADHSLGAVLYALKAIEATGGSVKSEQDWQERKVPKSVRELVVTAIERRAGMKSSKRTRATAGNTRSSGKRRASKRKVVRRSR